MSIPAKVFITGAHGFIGRALLQRYQALGAEVVGVDLQGHPGQNIHAADVAQAGAWQRLADGCELVIHTAAVVANSAPAQLYRAVSVGSVRLALEAALQGGASRFVHLSSIAAYGLDFSSERRETDAISLLSGYPYCDAKAASEHAALAAHAAGEIDCTIIRPGDVYGPGSRPWVLIPLAMIGKRQFFLPDAGQGVFSPVYIDNLVDGIVLAASAAQAAGQIFNITDGVSVSCAEFFAHHWRWAGHRGQVPQVPGFMAAAYTRIAHILLNELLKQNTEISPASLAMLRRRAGYAIAKAEKMLGYRAQVDLATGLHRTERWLRENALLR